MAYMKQALTDEEVKKLTLSGVKKKYSELASNYNKLIEQDVILCPKCNEFKARSNFYKNNDYNSGFFPICKECLLKMATDQTKDGYKDNKEKAIHTLMLMDLPFIEDIYDTAIADITNAVNEKNRGTAWQQIMVMYASLPQYRNKKFKDSEYRDNSEYNEETEIKEDQKIIKKAKKRFGNFYSNEDLMFLGTEFQDWLDRYECNTKTQESIFERLSCKKLEIIKATKNGQPTKDLDKTYTDLLSSANLLPRQNVGNAATDSLTFGQLIEKWELEKPIPTASPEFADVDNIGKYIRVWFTGWLGKAVGLKNAYTNECEEYIKQYKVTKPDYTDEENSENIYQKLFGSVGE